MSAPRHRLAVLGMVEGNGHPYSWSAICNGYDREAMAACPYPVIPQYLGAVPPDRLRIPGVQVTHIWTDDPADARAVAAASLIPNIVDRPEDVIGRVDAVLIATDIGGEHLHRSLPFVQAGLPVFIDKPLADCLHDLQAFSTLVRDGAKVLSSSCMRYAREFTPYHSGGGLAGPARYISIATPKSWERYSIHAIESVYPILGPGFLSVRNTGEGGRNIVHAKHRSGADVTIAAIDDLYAGFGALQILGPKDAVQLRFDDTYYAFRRQLEDFVDYLDTGRRPYPFAETEEMIRLLIAGIVSREQGGREVFLSELESQTR